MKSIPFVKYTSCGNNFVIIDETQTTYLSEHDKARFAYYATNMAFGIGCDNLLVIQRCDEDTLAKLMDQHSRWQQQPDAQQAEFIFRMFEPNGEEALCCGNGLICIANYLHLTYGIHRARIMTEIPLAEPSVLNIGCDVGLMGGFANMGLPRRLPEELSIPGYTHRHDEVIDSVDAIMVEFRFHDLKPYTEKTQVQLSGYLVFTGEPHLVVFPDHDFSVPELADYIFGTSKGSEQFGSVKQRLSVGSQLVQLIGSYLNSHYRHMFPAGINVNFTRYHSSGMVENRCFERGINRETLACGTGAMAAAYVSQCLHARDVTTTDVLPHRCRWHDPDALIRVQSSADGWLLQTNPTLLYEGSFRLTEQRLQPVFESEINIRQLHSELETSTELVPDIPVKINRTGGH